MKPIASVIIKDTDAEGGVDLSVRPISGGHHLNMVAKWVYDRAQNMTKDEEYLNLISPDGAMGEATISVAEVDDKVRFTIDFGEDGSREDFYPISHQLACFLVQESMKQLEQKAC